MQKTYSELLRIQSFEDRFAYLNLQGVVGDFTFGGHRQLNQILYNSDEWKSTRRKVILRDNGCDLGIQGYPIAGKILIHHMNPITIDDILNRHPCVFDLENLICCSMDTHNAIHYGNESGLPRYSLVTREPGDTCPWR